MSFMRPDKSALQRGLLYFICLGGSLVYLDTYLFCLLRILSPWKALSLMIVFLAAYNAFWLMLLTQQFRRWLVPWKWPRMLCATALGLLWYGLFALVNRLAGV